MSPDGAKIQLEKDEALKEDVADLQAESSKPSDVDELSLQSLTKEEREDAMNRTYRTRRSAQRDYRRRVGLRLLRLDDSSKSVSEPETLSEIEAAAEGKMSQVLHKQPQVENFGAARSLVRGAAGPAENPDAAEKPRSERPEEAKKVETRRVARDDEWSTDDGPSSEDEVGHDWNVDEVIQVEKIMQLHNKLDEMMAGVSSA